jgi:hypothetical protein
MIKGFKFWIIEYLDGWAYFIQFKQFRIIIHNPIYINFFWQDGKGSISYRFKPPIRLLIDKYWKLHVPF